MAVRKKIKVLMVDDLEVAVMAIEHIVNQQPDMVLYASAANPYDAVKVISKEKPDVILLDIQMPKMDGLTFLRKIMSQHPVPVVMFSGVAEKGSSNAIKALQLGAVSILPKPKSIINNFEFHQELVTTLRNAYAVKDRINKLIDRHTLVGNMNSPFTDSSLKKKRESDSPTDKVIAIGASTGGTQALHYILDRLPANVMGIVIVQHMPGNFTRWFAESLDNSSALKVYEAKPGMVLHKGMAVVANGFYHLILKKTPNEYVVTTHDGPIVNRHKPSVDELFKSVAKTAGSNGIGILLTGMGDDGAAGLLEMKKSGAITIAQDDHSAVVFGMPQAAIKINAAKMVMNLNEIINFIKNIDL
ncbi:MAG: chemotaxis response regulator protein-glutamate methylesterase [Bacteroidetes bacterium]|nr:MAG: chemotaxis response regulator protein-glutamate methylesterase [Bacteroidota bacterium]